MISGLPDTRIVNISLRVYRVLLASYPQSFRQEYAPHMLQAFGDYTRRVYQQRGLASLIWWWALTFFDFANSVLEEHLQGITNMTKEKFIRLGSWALMLGGITLFIGFLVSGESSAFGRSAFYRNIEDFLWVSMPILFATGYAALRRQYRDKMGSLGNFALLAGVITSLVGFLGMLAGFILNIEDIVWPSLMIFFMSAMLAMALLGFDALKRGYLPRWGSFPLIAGGLPILALMLQLILEDRPWGNTPIDPIIERMPLLFAIGAFLMGFMLLEDIKGVEKSS